MARPPSLPHPSTIDAPTVVVNRESGRTVVWLGGEHDIATTAMVGAGLGRAAAVGHDDVVVDLCAVRFMSAATLGSILRVRRTLTDQGRILTLRRPSPGARRLLDLCLVTLVVEDRPAPPSTTSRPRSARRSTTQRTTSDRPTTLALVTAGRTGGLRPLACDPGAASAGP